MLENTVLTLDAVVNHKIREKVLWSGTTKQFKIEPPRDKTNKMVCAPSEDSDQPGHPPSLIRVFAV